MAGSLGTQENSPLIDAGTSAKTKHRPPVSQGKTHRPLHERKDSPAQAAGTQPQNGRLPDSALSPINGGRLEHEAAAAFNAMDAESRRVYKVALRPNGPMSSYRTYAQQQYLWKLYQEGKGNLAARPGTSNHGWGLAVDLASHQMRTIVDKIGKKYGWAKEWSDAPGEWWHLRYRRGVWKDGSNGKDIPTLMLTQPPMKSDAVGRLQTALIAQGFKITKDDTFGDETYKAVVAFQTKNGLDPDGVVGPLTWKKLAK